MMSDNVLNQHENVRMRTMGMVVTNKPKPMGEVVSVPPSLAPAPSSVIDKIVAHIKAYPIQHVVGLMVVIAMVVLYTKKKLPGQKKKNPRFKVKGDELFEICDESENESVDNSSDMSPEMSEKINQVEDSLNLIRNEDERQLFQLELDTIRREFTNAEITESTAIKKLGKLLFMLDNQSYNDSDDSQE